MPLFDVMIQGKSYHVEVPDPGACPLRVIVDGQPFDVGIIGSESAARPTPSLQPPRVFQPASLPTVEIARPAKLAPTDVVNAVLAPMPGTILSVEVSVGQAVQPGQVLCVLEAMKMKNPIRALRDGVVTEILVVPGQSVAHGDVLVRLT